jgi:sugar lactone lactonase YvrE
VTEYVPPYTGAPVATITSGLSGPNALALDGAGNLFVSNETSNRVTIYAPPYTGTPTVVGTNSTLVAPFALALDGAGDLFVANFNAANVTEFAPPYTGSPIATIPTGTGPRALVLTP